MKFAPGTALVLMALPRGGGLTLSAEDLGPATGVRVDRVVDHLGTLHALGLVLQAGPKQPPGRSTLWRLSANGRKTVAALITAV